MRHTITLGTDPEIVGLGGPAATLVGQSPNSLIAIPGYHALGLVDPDAALPLPFGNVGADGAAVEWRQNPTSDVDQMVREVGANIQEIAHLVATSGIAKLSVIPHFPLEKEWIHLLNESYGNHSSVAILGCAPDHNVYSLEYPKRPDPKEYLYRTLGGHIHVGLPKGITEDPVLVAYFVAGLDQLIGTAGTYWCNSIEAFNRKVLYGKAGMVRVKENLGLVEYRPLPSQALVQTEDGCFMVFRMAQAWGEFVTQLYESAVSQIEVADKLGDLIGGYETLINTVVPAINDHDIESCREIQLEIAHRLSPEIVTIAEHMQKHTLPDNFDLRGW